MRSVSTLVGFVALLAVFFISSSVHAAYTTPWKTSSGSSATASQADTPAASCQLFAANAGYPYYAVTFTDDVTYQCQPDSTRTFLKYDTTLTYVESCAEGEAYDPVTDICTPPPPTDCSATTGKNYWIISEEGDTGTHPATACKDGCEFEVQSYAYMVEEVGMGWAGDYTGNGQSCSGGPAELPEESSSTNCIQNSSGDNLACYQKLNDNCGTLNGEQVCLDNVPEGNCTLLPGGSFICDGAATPPENNDGTPTEKTADITKYDSTGTTSNTYSYYDTKSYGTGGMGEGGGEEKDTCGLPGTPPCKIDETGTPEKTDTEYDSKIDDTGIQGLIDNVGENNIISEPVYVPTLPTGSCQTLTIMVLGHPLNIPSAQACGHLETFKSMLAWFLYIITAIGIYQIATRRPA